MPVYFIQSELGGPIKIGHASSVKAVIARRTSLQSGNPHKLLITHIEPDKHVAYEREIHKMFDCHRLSGEWFLPNEALCEIAKAKNYDKRYEDKPRLFAKDRGYCSFERKRRSDLAKELQARGVFGGKQPGAGRPKGSKIPKSS